MRAWRRASASPQRPPASSRMVRIQIHPMTGATFAPPKMTTSQVSTAIAATEIAPSIGDRARSAIRTRRR
jgi:hypothetical protein